MDLGATTLTYLFSDLEGSTRLWERHPDAMHDALARHDAILRDAVQAAGGTVVKTTGDGLMAVFEDAAAAVSASVDAQRGLRDETWGVTGPLRVRMGMHLGESQARAGDYYGTAVNRAARVMAAAHGGQVLLSAPTASEVVARLPAGVGLRDLGTHRLKDLAGPEQVFQVVVADLPDTFPPLQTLDLRPNNLPTQTSAFLGREKVLADLRALLDGDDVRLVTLTGPGGTGKTRLALHASAEQIDRFDDGVFFVDVSAEREPEGVFAAILRAVGLGGTGDDPALQALQRGLRERQMLLVLDNVEQVTAAATGLVELLQQAPRLRMLVTSREALRVRGEQLFPVPPLTLPAGDLAGLTVDAALNSEAVRLFADRAGATRPDFVVTDDNVADVAAICRRLDGLPLAIELAAARVNLFAVDELRERLDKRLDVLQAGARDLPARQQTLTRAIEWSTDLLTDHERLVMRAFSVFVGARLVDVEATLASVDELAGLQVVELLGSLVDKSLVRSGLDDLGRPRFSMLQTIRDYATAQLDRDAACAASVRHAHADHYTRVAVELRSMLGGRDRDEVLGALAAELGNFRAAWSHWVTAGDVLNLNALLEPLWGYYDARGQYGAAIELANDMLAVLRIQPETVERVRDEIALEMSLARSLLTVRGYTAEVERTVMAAVDRARESGDAHLQFPVLRSLATLHLMRSDYVSGAEVGRELLEIAEQQREPILLSDAHLVVGVNTAFNERLADGVDHLDRSIAHFDEAAAGLVQFRVGPSPGVVAHMVSGLMLWMLGFPDRAGARVTRGIEVAEQLGHPYSLAYGVFHAAVLEVFRKDLPSVHRQGDRLLQIANANDYGIWRALAFVLRGMARVGGGDAEGGLTELERGFTLYRGMKTPPVFWPFLQMLRAFGYAMAGRVDEALGFLADGKASLPDGDFQAADFDLARAEMLLAIGTADRDEVRALCEASLDLAERAGARMTQIQAATHLVRLSDDGAGQAEARERLRAILDGFTEGFGTAPLVAAKAALDG